MNIQILDSWLREHLKTKATPQKIGEIMSAKSASFERIEKLGTDYLYDIEITTNRVDMMSVAGLAREAAVALSSEGIDAEYIEKEIPNHKINNASFPIKIVNSPNLCTRICAAILEVEIGKSPQIIRDRLEATDIRSLNNVIDVTNYVMRELGHPMHAFDADKISDTFIIREAKKGEKIVTLDKKEHTLLGGEIVAENATGEIIDLLGIMGLVNSSVTDNTKRIMLFIDNNDSKKIRDASMNLNIRTDAAVLNEKDVDPELGIKALNRGIQLLAETANGKLIGSIFDEHHKYKVSKPISVSFEKINQVIGIQIPKKQVEQILEGLGFKTQTSDNKIDVTPPSYRVHDIDIPEDIIEEVARMYGYHKIPSILPNMQHVAITNLEKDVFFWENRVKSALKYWGFTEVYTYSLISGDMLEIETKDAVELSNPLSSDMVYLRTSLIPSLLQVLPENKSFEKIQVFELSNVYHKIKGDLPAEKLMLAGVIKNTSIDFLKIKGIIETLAKDLGITHILFKKSETSDGADMYIGKTKIGDIEILSKNVINFEIDYEEFIKHATLKKTYTPVPKYPSASEDLRIKIDENIEFSKIVEVIKTSSPLVISVVLLDTYEDKKTFRITYQNPEKSLTNAEITQIRELIISALQKELRAEIS